MEFDRPLPKSIHSPLDELFLVFYDAPTLRQLYTENYLPTLKHSPPRGVPRKKDIAEALLRLNEKPEQMQAFVAQFPAHVRQVLAALLWQDEIPLDEFEAQLGRKIALEKPPHQIGYYTCPFSLVDDYYLLVIWREKHNRYLGPGEAAHRSDCCVCLPRAIRDWLSPHFPKPTGYYFEGQQKMPEHSQHFNCEAHAIQDLVTTADFIRRGGVQLTQNGQLSRTSLKNLAAATAGGEPYADETSIKALPYFRHNLLINFVERLPAVTAQLLADAAIQPKRFLRECLLALSYDIDWAVEHLLPHLRLRRPYGWNTPDSSNQLDATLRILGRIPAGRWLTRQDLLTYCRYRNLDGVFFELKGFDVEMSVEAEDIRYYTRHCYRHELALRHLAGVVTWPLLSALALTLSALGLLEIAYERPRNEQYRGKRRDYLSPYEGVQAIRLTEIGAYAFGQSELLEVPEFKSNALELHFHPQRLHLRVENIDAITEKTLASYMDRIGGGIYKISRESFLKGCDSTAAVATHIEQFQRSIPAELPPNWQQFFHELKAEPAVLQRENQWTVFRLPENEGIRRAFAQDPILREHCRKVEGWRVAIDSKKLKIVENHLRKLGLFPH